MAKWVPAVSPARITLLLFAVLFALTWWRYSPPAPLGDDAAPERFSAMRARAVQEKLVGDGTTRAVGAPNNARGREAMALALTKAGWTVETQDAMTCTHYGACTPVTNVVAHLDGTEPALPGVLITAHHDSVGAGPGASDDGLGVASIVETARAIAAAKRPRRTIVAVLTDGEEAGLAGADAFVRGHPLAANVRATVNVDSRGSSGPSQMFETSRGNAWLAALMAEHLPRPVTTSLYYEVYRRMPNDTDFSVTKTIASGVNFANISHIEHYHTPLDDLAHSDLGTLQHHGDHVLAMTRAFADGEIAAKSDQTGDAVWFDVLALGIVHWPENWSILLAIIAFAFVLRHSLKAKVFDRGWAVFPAALLVGAVTGLGYATVLDIVKAVPSPWIAIPLPAVLSIQLAGIAGALAAIRLLAVSPRGLWAGTWLGWALLGIVVSKIAPGASYLFIAPALVAGVTGAIRFDVACIAPAVVAALLILPMCSGLYDALGFAVAPLLSLPLILLVLALAPMLTGDKRIIGGVAALGLVAVLAAAVVPKYTAEHPQRVNVEFRQDEAGARVFVDNGWGPRMKWGTPPEAMLKAAGATDASPQASPLPWMAPVAYGDAPVVSLAAPTFAVASAIERDGKRIVRGRVTSERAASLVAFWFTAARHIEVKVDGHYAYTRSFGGAQLLAIAKPTAEIEITADGAGPLECELVDRSLGLPPGSKAEAVRAARPKEAVASQEGDLTVVSRKLSL